MSTLKFDTKTEYGIFKPLNATNGGPIHKRHVFDQVRSNIKEYESAKIPFSRNHDSNLCASYGAPYVHDISAIFPDFTKDESDPGNYQFENTDESILITLDAGTKTFFRLGQSIEHAIKKINIHPPKNYLKWAKICEHIIRHYTEGWGNGYTLDMPYWEIWNEPDLDPDDSTNKRCWTGTKSQFFDFYEVVARYLKSCFPHLKIGGPAVAWDEAWTDEFLSEMKKRHVPIDFLSWHIYATEPYEVTDKAERYRNMLDKYGFNKTESILNEWNYVKGWTDDFIYTIESIGGIKGATFMMSVISEAQKSSIDMLMYYDTRPSVFNSVFDFYTCHIKKGFYPLKWYGEFYGLEKEIRCQSDISDIYTLAGVDKDGKATAIITHYSDNDNKKSVKVKIELNDGCEYDVYLLDKDHDGEFMGTMKKLTFEMPVFTSIMVKQK